LVERYEAKEIAAVDFKEKERARFLVSQKP